MFGGGVRSDRLRPAVAHARDLREGGASLHRLASSNLDDGRRQLEVFGGALHRRNRQAVGSGLHQGVQDWLDLESVAAMDL